MIYYQFLLLWGFSLLFWIVILGIIALLVLAGLYLAYYLFLKKKGAFPSLPCKLRTYTIMKDECAGACPPGQTCVVTATRPYGPWGIFGKQASACACKIILQGGGTGGGTGGGAGDGH